MVALREAFYSACAVLHLDFMHPHLYYLRHGGASHDLLTKRRPLAEIKARGRWATDQSLKRYAKSTQLQRILAKMPEAVRSYGDDALNQLEQLVLNRARVGSTGLPLPGLHSLGKRRRAGPSGTSSTARSSTP